MKKALSLLVIWLLTFSVFSLLTFEVKAATFFSDGFEGGDFSAWTNTAVESGNTLEVQSNTKHHGTYGAHAKVSAWSNWAVARKKISPKQATLYARMYIRHVTLPTDTSNMMRHIQFRDAIVMNNIANLITQYDGGTVKWGIWYLSSGTTYSTLLLSSPTPSLNVWYCVELRVVVSGTVGEVRFYLDGEEKLSATNLDNDQYGNVGAFYTGIQGTTWGTAKEIYWDCVVTSDSYIGLESMPPTTTLSLGSPHYIDANGNYYLTSNTPLTLDASSPVGAGIAATSYKIYNAEYDSGWTVYTAPFYFAGLGDGFYDLDFNSTDYDGNVESTKTEIVILDNIPPALTVETPSTGDALQDGVTLKVSAWDLSTVSSLTFSIHDDQGNVISPAFESMEPTPSSDGKWQLNFDTTQLPDGYYLFIVEGSDVFGNTGTETAPFSIRNWACVEMLPATENNKARRTMPVKFSVRIIEAVDPAQPFVWNQELTIFIYQKDPPQKILQTSTYGTRATDYRIDAIKEHYITNFRTLRTPATYVVDIYRKGMLIGTFEFSTVK